MRVGKEKNTWCKNYFGDMTFRFLSIFKSILLEKVDCVERYLRDIPYLLFKIKVLNENLK